ncbi:MAG TPA: YARHG domain-containing protein [Hyphomicrobium sp.]|nr:YARHG domain-containing protein [Hyphomicrobium sp.]
MKRLWGPLAALAASVPAGAGQAEEVGLCYETIGCVQNRLIDVHDAEKLGCDQLWTVRNGIYAVRGYCFKTERGKQNFSNEGCNFNDEAEVPLNDYERANVKLIRELEQRRNCG